MAAPRETRVDLIRGICLLLIFVGHSHFVFSALIQEGRGFSDASELFVLLAGFSCALAYAVRGAGSRPKAVQAGRATRRAVTIYAVHVALVSALMRLAALGALFHHRAQALAALRIPPVENLAAAYGKALLLGFMPGELDILPLYVVLLLALPIAGFLLRRSSRLLLLASAALWIASGMLRLNLPNGASLQGHWYFAPLSWQFVFVIGLALGWRAKRGLDPLPFHRGLYLAAWAFALAAVPMALALHLELFGPDLLQTGAMRTLAGKTHAGPLRLLNAVAILYALWHWQPFNRWARSATAGPVLAAGRNSLPVFALGLVLSSALSVPPALGLALPLAAQIALCLAGIAAQLAFATGLQRRREVRGARDGALARAI